jgi:4-amino-4-deoxy-L-arabinose transferase-like glycosyltransferase
MSRPDSDSRAQPAQPREPGAPRLEADDSALRRRVDELEREVERLKNAPPRQTEPPRDRHISIRGQASRIGLAVLATLAAAPPALVILDRWLDRPITAKALLNLWCRSEFLCQLSLPSYFALIPLCFAALAAGLWAWRREPIVAFSNLNLGKEIQAPSSIAHWQDWAGKGSLSLAGLILLVIIPLAIVSGRVPGWDLIIALILYVAGWTLRDVNLESLASRIIENRGYYFALFLFQLALCAALFTLFSHGGGSWIFFLLLGGAFANLLLYASRIPTIYWIMSASLVALTWGLDAWQYMAVGDEYAFFYDVHNYIQNSSLLDIGNRLFDGQFVYQTHPFLSSVIQAAFMRLFNFRNFGWRFSNPYLSALSLALFYYFFKIFFSRHVALAATVIIGFNHYLISFSKIGYNNLQALLVMALVLALAAWALRSMRYLAFVLLGLGIGLCFYVYPGALYVVPLPLLLILIFAPPTSKPNASRWGSMLLSTILLIFPLFPQTGYWLAKVPGTFYFKPELVSSSSALLQHSGENIIYSFFSFLFIPQESHFVSTAYMGPLAGALIMVGMAFGLKLVLQRNRTMAFVIISFVVFLIFVGASHDRQYPAATRMFLFVPWFGLFAAMGWAWLREAASPMLPGGLNASRSLVLMLAAVIAINLYEAHVVDVRRMQNYHDLGPLFLRTVRQIESRPELPPKTTVFISDPSWRADGMQVLVDVYQTPPSMSQIQSLSIDTPQIPEESLAHLANADTLVILKPWLDEEWKQALGDQLAGIGKVPCDIKTAGGDLRFRLWHSGDLGWLCPQ